MNRLWVRLALLISGVLCLVFLWQFGVISLDHRVGPGPTENVRSGAPDDHQPKDDEIVARLIRWLLFSLVVGAAAGFLIAQLVTRPVSTLARAARAVGRGDLETRVAVRGSRETRELAETFNRMASELQRAEQVRKNLLADISHELRTPLGVLEGSLRAALDNVSVMDDSSVANLYQQVHHLTRLVSDLRELSLADARKLSLHMSSVDLGALAAEAVQSVEPLASERGLVISCAAAGVPLVQADEIRVRQILFNLLSNAIFHTPSSGQILVSAFRDGENAVLRVADTGEGLPAQALDCVFDRFYRVDQSRSRESGGSGLGLAIVKGLAETHGGSAAAKSDGVGKGSTFEVRLPLRTS